MLDKLGKAWRRNRSVMAQMPTGTGKTHLMAAAIKGVECGVRSVESGVRSEEGGVLVVAHRIELIQQISQTLDSFGIDHGLIVSGQETDYSKKVQVASIQTLTRRCGHTESTDAAANPSLFTLHFSLIIVDEAHHALAETYRQLWEWWPKAKFLGLTATPCRLNGKPFTDLFDTLLQSWTIREFIQKGWLSDLDYVSVRSDSRAVQQIARLDKRSVDGDFQTKQMAMVMDVPESIEHLYRSYKQYADGKKGIVYAIDRSHAQHIAEYYSAHGVRCAVIDAKTPAESRRALVAEYRAARLTVLVNVDIFSEGFDCPEVEFIQLARPTMSLSKYLQQVGRGMRVTESKKEVMVLDQVGLYLFFGLPTSDRNWQATFLGNASGKGVLRVLGRKNGWSETSDKTLANEEMFRIKSVVNRKGGTNGKDYALQEYTPVMYTADPTRRRPTKELELFSIPYDGLTRMYMKSLKPRKRPEEYVTHELFALLTRKEIIVHIYKSYKKYADGRRGVITACSYIHAELIADFFTRNGVRTRPLFDINGLEVADAMTEFLNGDTAILVLEHRKAVLPEVEFIQLTYPMQLMSDYLNKVYSCMLPSTDYQEKDRVRDSDNKLIVIDNTLMSEKFGSPAEKRDGENLQRMAAEQEKLQIIDKNSNIFSCF